MRLLPLAWRLLRRDWRAGELRILLFALLIAVSSVTSIHLFTQRVDLAIQEKTGDFLGGDLLLTSPTPFAQAILDLAKSNQMKTSAALLFATVVVVGDRFQLAELKAVDEHYPLRNQIQIEGPAQVETALNHGPPAGEVWLEPRLLPILHLNLGDAIEIGEANFRVSAILQKDPGQSTSLINIAPRILMNLQDIDRAKLIQPGSRLTYQLLFAGAADKRANFEGALHPLLNPTQRLLGGKEGSPALNSAITRAEQYFALSTVFSILLAGIAVAMAANRYSERHFDQTALMRCMGATQNQCLMLYAIQLLILGVTAGVAGCLLGYFTQEALVYFLADVVPKELPAANLFPYVTGFATGLLTLAGFSLPALIGLKSIPPLRVLRRDLVAVPVSSMSLYGLTLLGLLMMMWWQSGSLQMTLILMIGIALTVLFLQLIANSLFSANHLLAKKWSGPWRIGVQQLIRFRKYNQLQMLAFGLALMVLLTITLVRTDLVEEWKSQLPDKAPNHFVINIQPDQVIGVQDFFVQHQMLAEGMYPMVRGRVVSINGVAIKEALDAESLNDEALKRELNLSWAANLQANNQLIEGQWWTVHDEGKLLISIERRLAQRLQVKIGDRLGFNVGDQKLEGEIRSVRAVQWDSFQPNFYIIFPPESIKGFPTSYISSFYLDPQNASVIPELVAQYPSLTLIDVEGLLQQVKSILKQVTSAVEFLLLFLLLSALMVLLASIQSSMDHRIQSAVVMRALGAQNNFMRKSQVTEFLLLGLYTGLLAAIGTELIAFGLYHFVFSLPYWPHLWVWVLGPLISVLLIGATGLAATARVLRESPANALRV